MGYSKKTAKGRLDKYYFLAKEQGYRARSAFKLVQLHKKYNLLDQARVVIDLCAAPGGWLQVAAKYMPVSHVIVGVDLVPIKPIPGVKSIVADITTEKCRAELKRELKNWKADVVLHDGAPNVGRSWLHDAYSQAELVLHSLKLATEFLNKDGSFVTKVFRSKDYNSLMWVFNQLFSKVEATKPASSRSVSAEIFVVCRGFKAPDKIDQRLLDPKHVFEDISLLQNTSAKVDLLHPEKKQRHRSGYDDGVTMLFKSITAKDFIESSEPNTVLATYNQITFDPSTPQEIEQSSNVEIKEICQDLKVIGKREFKLLSKWRKDVRTKLGLVSNVDADNSKHEEVIEVNEEDPLKELEGLTKKVQKQEKREHRKALERKAKQRMRMQLSMGNADDLADEFAQNEPLFSLKMTKNNTLIDGNEDVVIGGGDSEDEKESVGIINEDEIDTLSENSEEVLWESELEEFHTEGIQNQLKKNPVELLRSERNKNGMEDSMLDDTSSDDEVAPDDDENESNELVTSLVSKEEQKAEQNAKMALWYSNPLFKELEVTADKANDMSSNNSRSSKLNNKRSPSDNADQDPSSNKKKTRTPGEIIFVKADKFEADEEEEEGTPPSEETKKSVMTPSGMTLASKLVRDKKRAKMELVDDSFNRYSFKDEGMIPRWFLDDENRHNRPQKPITKEGVALLRAKMKELDARPIKKELEAKGRHRRRALKKMEALKKKAAVIADSEDIGEKQKGEQIQKLLSKANKPQKKETKLVIAKGRNRGVKGRPNGIKGHYKMVDGRMKKDLKAQKRLKQKQKQKGRKRR